MQRITKTHLCFANTELKSVVTQNANNKVYKISIENGKATERALAATLIQ
jgi:hypothetical protein